MMQKIVGVVLCMAFLLLSGCSSTGSISSSQNGNNGKVKFINFKADSIKGTPSDSVVVYGCFLANKRVMFSQMHPDFPKEHIEYQTFGNGMFVTKPLQPGSVYRVTYMSGDETRDEETWKWDGYLPMNETALDILVPEEPGLYYYGSWSGKSAFENIEKMSIESYYQNVFVIAKGAYKEPSAEIRCLKQVLKRYKGTKWEKLISQRIYNKTSEL